MGWRNRCAITPGASRVSLEFRNRIIKKLRATSKSAPPTPASAKVTMMPAARFASPMGTAIAKSADVASGRIRANEPPTSDNRRRTPICLPRPRSDHLMRASHDALEGSEPVMITVSALAFAPRNRERTRVPPEIASAPDPCGRIASALSPASVTAGPGKESHQRSCVGAGAVSTPEAAEIASRGESWRSTRGSGARTTSFIEVSATE